MAFLTLQILAVIFALFAWSRTLLRYKDHKMTIGALGLWSFVWIGIIVAALVPQTSSYVANALGVARPVDVLVYGSIVVLFYMVFRLYVLLEAARHERTLIVRKIEVMNAKKRK